MTHPDTPPGAPARDENDILGLGFVNYVVNRSALSEKSGPHLGDTAEVSALAGRTDAVSIGRWAASSLDSLISDNPLSDVGAVRKMAGGVIKGTLGKVILSESAEATAKQGIDVADRRSLDRLVQVFDGAAETGDLPTWGATEPATDVDSRLAELRSPTLPADHRFPADNPHAPLYDKVRGMLPDSVSDAQAAQVTLHARRDTEIGGPHELLKIELERGHAFVGGTTPGFRCAVDLSQPPSSIADIVTQLREVDQQLTQRTEQSQTPDRGPPSHGSI